MGVLSSKTVSHNADKLSVTMEEISKVFTENITDKCTDFLGIAQELVSCLSDLKDPATNLLSAGTSLAYGTTFLTVVSGLRQLVGPLLDHQAQKQIAKYYQHLGKDVEQINKSLQGVERHLASGVNYKHQFDFAQHVHDFVSHTSSSSKDRKRCIFVYNIGTEWHPCFHRLVKENPLPDLYGIFDDLNIMFAYLIFLRKCQLIDENTAFYILMPTTSLTYFPVPCDFARFIGPTIIMGEKNNDTGCPYVHLKMPPADSVTFVNVARLEANELSPPNSSSWRRKFASTTAACAAGVGAAMIAGPGAIVAGGAVAIAVLPEVAAGFVALGSGIGAAAVAGPVTAIFVHEKVKNANRE